ncbi:hypothetical protein ACLUUI_19885 [Enterobacterales bacterium AW_CKDN230030176-1A_HGKHYDSX7]
MDPISTVDDNLARIARLAEQLQRQLAPCPVSQMRLYAWIAEWTRTADGLRAAEQCLPKLPQALCDDYLAWVHGGAH